MGYRSIFPGVDASVITTRTSNKNVNTKKNKNGKLLSIIFARMIHQNTPYYLEASFCKPGFPRNRVQDRSKQLVFQVYRER